MAADFEHLADFLHTQLVLVNVIHDDRVRLLEVGDVAFHQVPRQPHLGVRIQADDLY